MNHHSILFLVLFSLFSGSVLAERGGNDRGGNDRGGNGMDRGGGGEGALEFRTAGSEIVDYLTRWRDAGTLEPELAAIDIEAFRAVVQGTVVTPATRPLRLRIDLCSYHPDLTEVQQCAARGVRRWHRMPVTAINNSRTHTIQLDEERWSAWGSSETRYSIALHEYRGMMNPEDRLYAESQVFLRHLRLENDAERFRTELRGRLTTLASAFRPMLIMDIRGTQAFLQTIRTTDRYRACAGAPRGRDARSLARRLELCLGFAQRLYEIVEEVNRDTQAQAPISAQAGGESAHEHYLRWTESLPEAQREYAVQLADTLVTLRNDAWTRLLVLHRTFLNMLEIRCPGTTADAAVCILDTYIEHARVTMPETGEEELTGFDRDSAAIAEQATAYVAR